MSHQPLGVAVIGAGMVGRAHANAYRSAATVFDLDLPAPRLVAIADLGSLANAARALHLAAPTVTVQIAELESRLGGQLLVRGRGPAQATALGERFIARARRLLADADDAVEDVRRQLAGQTGRVRVGASTGAIAHLLPPALERLARNHPGIDVNVQVLTSNESMARLAAGSLDLAVVST